MDPGAPFYAAARYAKCVERIINTKFQLCAKPRRSYFIHSRVAEYYGVSRLNMRERCSLLIFSLIPSVPRKIAAEGEI